MNNPHSGSSFDAFLAEEGILEEVSARALKHLLALQVAEIMANSNISKSALATSLETSRSQVARLLDPENTAITLESLDKLARAVEKTLRVEIKETGD